MNDWVSALRAVHYACTMLLLGEILFAVAIAGPPLRRATAAAPPDGDRDRRFFTIVSWSLAGSLASGATWFAAQAALMSGLPVAEAMTAATLGLVFGETTFGLVFAVRAGLAVALAALLTLMRRSTDAARRRILASAAALAAGYLGSIAWTGHAVTGDEAGWPVLIVADVAHLLAAGAWLGALPALVFALGRAQAGDAAAAEARRFSRLGAVSVGLLAASGLVNTWYQVGGVPGMVGTDYGRLLVAKLALFAAMLALATVNRGIATRPTAGDDHGALRRLRRNAMLEIAFGIGVLAIVGVLGVTVPATHEPAIWPFARTLSLDAIRQTPWAQFVVAAAGAGAGIAGIAVVVGALRRPPRLRLVAAAAAAVAVAAAIIARLLAVPSYPTTYLVSPVRYTADAIATGATRYAASCSACHGRHGGGDGSLSLPDAPLDLNGRVPDRREGDLFWSIAHGVPGTRMPGFASQMSDVEIWSLVQFLDAQTAAQNATSMSDRIRPLRPVPAPDFTYEIPGRPQESLRQMRDNRATLVVFYTMPFALPRLRELAALVTADATAEARVIALPMPASAAATAADTRGAGASMLARASPAAATTYLMFARRAQTAHGARNGASDGNPLTHVEFLIDRFGFLRLRWLGVPEGGAVETLRQAALLAQEPPRAQVQWGHRH